MKARVSLLQGGSSAMASSRPARVSSSLPASEGRWEGGVCVCVGGGGGGRREEEKEARSRKIVGGREKEKEEMRMEGGKK